METTSTSSLIIERRDMPRMDEQRELLPPTVPLIELVVDGVPLSERLGIVRASLSFMASRMESSDLRELTWFANVLLGKEAPWNQFQTNRVVLYGCHCGVDYCGFISCEVVVLEREVVWRKIGHEDGDGLSDFCPVIDELRFLRAPYEYAVSAAVRVARIAWKHSVESA